MLASGIVAVLIWVTFIVFSYRRFGRITVQERENKLLFTLQAAPLSDLHVESLLERNPRSPAVLHQYVTIASERKDWPEALRRAVLFTTRVPRSARAWTLRINLLRNAGRAAEATELLRETVRRMPREPDVLVAWAREAAARRDWAEAARRFERVRQRAPGRWEGYNDAANALMELGRYDEAEALLAVGKRLSKSWVHWQAAATLAARTGDIEEAIRRWEELRARFPSESSGFVGGSEALMQAGREAEALALIRQARDFFPASKEIAQAAKRLDPPRAAEGA